MENKLESGKTMLAEVIAVGDEMTSGQRLDTNTQWLATQLNDLGIPVAWHSTVGDDLGRQTDVIRIALERADIVVMTGGLGPTKDDLTRDAISAAAGVELELQPHVLEHIKAMFRRFRKPMSPANKRQAWFPIGTQIVDNPEGTAPGIDLSVELNRPSRVFALPGVPAEMKQMWESHVGPGLAKLTGDESQIFHHTLRCFGVGESECESKLPDLMARDREPRVGITASSATISFRISAHAESESDFQTRIAPTVELINSTLGDVVFGSGDVSLQDVVSGLLVSDGLTVSMIDFGFAGASARLLQSAQSASKSTPVRGHYSLNQQSPDEFAAALTATGGQTSLEKSACHIGQTFGTDFGIAIGPLVAEDKSETAGDYSAVLARNGTSGWEFATRSFRYGGHSSFRDLRAAKQIVNFLRLWMLSKL